MKLKLTFLCIGLFALGVLAGGYLFAKTQPRSVLSVAPCDHCLSPNELAGLVGSVVVNRAPGLLNPLVVYETNKAVALKNPAQSGDYVIIPKKDIKDVGDLSAQDAPYLQDAYAVAEHIIQQEHLRNYTLKTYGPGYQQVRYLHFHLTEAKE